MKKELLKYLICPECSSVLNIRELLQANGEIEEGVLICSKCESQYPIIKGIPRMLPRDLMETLVTGYSDFLSRYNLRMANTPTLTAHATDTKIAKGFEFEWQKHAAVLPEHEKEFFHVLGDIIKADDIKGKLILDAGCGQGRFSYFYKKNGASTIISFDLGEQVLIARKNLEKIDDVHVVQASIYNPPFSKNIFDLISSIGVIHHLPDPEKGFKTLYGLLKEEGKIFIWVYGYSNIIRIIRLLRYFTLSRSVKFNRIFGFFFAVPLYFINAFYNFMNLLGLKTLAEKIPWHMYHDRGFSNIWTICFDKLNSAIAFYYKREDLQGWLDRLPDLKLGILSERYPGKSGSSWRLMALKNRIVNGGSQT